MIGPSCFFGVGVGCLKDLSKLVRKSGDLSKKDPGENIGKKGSEKTRKNMKTWNRECIVCRSSI